MKKCPRVCAKQNATIKLSYMFESCYYIETKENQFPNSHKDKIQEKWKKRYMHKDSHCSIIQQHSERIRNCLNV